MLNAEIADTPAKQAKGLMFRRHLREDEAMLFKFNKPQKLSFWGVNTYIPLDIAFIKNNGKIAEISHIRPMSDKLVKSSEDCTMALEANLDFFYRNNINPGDKAIIKDKKSSSAQIDFLREGQPASLKRTRLAQQMMDWDAFDEGEDEDQYVQNIDESKEVDIDNLPEITEDNIGQYIVDEVDDKQIRYDDVEQYDLEQNEISPPDEQEIEAPEYEPPEEDYPEFSTPQQAINWAQENNEVVHVWYTTKNGTDIERVIEPHGQFSAETTGNQILVSFDRTIGDIRAFILDNVLHYGFIGKDFQPKFTVKR